MKKTYFLIAAMLLLAGLAASPAYTASIVVNGEFEAGNSGFTSDYTYVSTPGGHALWTEGTYAVGTNPNDWHSNFYSMGDHTSGSGLMMIVNGDGNTSKKVWQGTVNVDLVIGNAYDFSAWVCLVSEASIPAPASLTFKADGTTIGTVTTGIGWTRLFGTFTAASLRPTLTLVNAQGALSGNDFALDDINIFYEGTTEPPPAGAPEIDIKRPSGTGLPDPSIDPMGEQYVGCGKTLTYTIENTGTAQLNVTSANSFNPVNISSYMVISTLPLHIPPGGNETLTVSFCIDAPGPFNFDIDIVNNDADEGTYDIDPEGTGISPEINIQRPAGTDKPDGSIDNLGNQLVGCGRTLVYTIQNTGTTQLDVTSANSFNPVNISSYAVVTTLPLHIAAGSSATLTVTFCIDALGPFNFDIDFISNDADEGTYDVDPEGIGVAPEINVQRPAGTNKPDPSIDNLGDLLIGCGRTLDYTIQNLGTAQLDVSTANAFNLVNVSGYTVVTPLPLHIAPASSATLTVTFCLDVPGPFNFDIDIISNDADEGTYDVDPEGTAWPPPEAIFYATPTMGCLGTTIRFENDSKGMTNAWVWDFGDGQTSTDKEPVYVYPKPGQYSVTLIASNPAAKDTLSITKLIWIYGYGAIGWAPLELVDNSYALDKQPWDSAIDGDVSGWEGTATVEGTPPHVAGGNPPFAIFEFQDGTEKPINKVRLLTDTYVGFAQRWVSDFRVMVSTTGIADGNFSTVLTGKKIGGGWQEFAFPQVQAKYIKLVIDFPDRGWRQIGEFQVCPVRKIPARLHSTMVATSPHVADGLDQSLITMTIRDENGELITGFHDEDFCIWATPEPNLYFPVIETNSPGVYVTQLATLFGGAKTFGASVIGVPLGTVPITFTQPPLSKAALEFVDGSQAWQNQEWDNAIDDDILGWDGTVTAAGAQCYAIFKFVDNGVRTVQKLAMLTDTGVGYPKRWATRFHLLFSVTGLNDTDFIMAYDGLQNRGGWQNHVFPAANAKYIKLIIDFPTTGLRQLGEIQVFGSPLLTMPTAFDKPADNLAKKLAVPEKFSVSNSYPNPFNPVTQVDFTLPEASSVSVVIYNTLGKKVCTLLDETIDAGFHTVKWNGVDDAAEPLPSGAYFFRLQAGDNLSVQKVLMIK